MSLSKAVVLVHEPDTVDPGAVAQAGAQPLDCLPRQLLPVANRPLLLHALEAIGGAGIAAAAIIAEEAHAPAVRAAVEAYPPADLEFEVRSCPRAPGLGAALSAVRDFVEGEPFMLHRGDSLQRCGLQPLVNGPDLGFVDARVLTCGSGRQLRSRLTPGSLTPRVEPLRRNGSPPPALDYGGVCVLGRGALEVAADLNIAGDSPFEAGHLVQALSEHGGHVEMLRAVGGWRLGSHLEGWLEGNRLALEGLVADPPDEPLFDTDIQGSVAIHPSAEIRSSVIRGPAVIGPMARLTDAYVGPYTSIGAGVLIEAAEIEHSIILPGASIRYLGGRLEASIIGSRARIFRDFRLPKAMRLNVGDGAEVALA